MPETTLSDLQQALATWRQWTPAPAAKPEVINTLNSGRSHSTFLLRSGQQQFALRLENPRSRDLAMSKTQEVTLMRAAGDLAPALVWSDEHSLVTQFVHGCRWQPPQQLASLCQALRRLHAQSLDLPEFDLARHCDTYWQCIECGTQPVTAAFRDLHRQCRAVLGKLLVEYPQQVVCHNDLNPDNIVFSDQGFVFLDWEYASYNSPYFELATLAEFFCFTNEQSQQLCLHYWHDSAVPLDDHLDALHRFRLAVRFTEWLWLTLKQDLQLSASEQRLKKLLRDCR